jgi:hypothetical protein
MTVKGEAFGAAQPLALDQDALARAGRLAEMPAIGGIARHAAAGRRVP